MAMDDHSHSPSPWLAPNCFMGVGVQHEDAAELEADDYLKQALVRTTLELESTRLVAQEELKKLEAQSLHLAHLLQIATRERDEARHNCHSLLLLLSSSRANPNPSPGPNLEESSNTASSSEEEEEESSKLTSPPPPPPPPPPERERGLPERGRLVEAVMRAGPLLQTLLLAGPLPQWRHPPPAVQSFEIPPVSISVSPTNGEKKRKREDRQQQQSPPPPPNLNVNSSSLDSNASTKVHHHHHHHNLQQFGSLRA